MGELLGYAVTPGIIWHVFPELFGAANTTKSVCQFQKATAFSEDHCTDHRYGLVVEAFRI